MSGVNAEQLKQQIAILKQVLVLRENEENDSPYVCDNVRYEVEIGDNEDEFHYAKNAICADIRQYINNAWSVREWAEQRDNKLYPHTDEELETERIKMINTLIERYEAQLETE